jgi:hypothetical protein
MELTNGAVARSKNNFSIENILSKPNFIGKNNESEKHKIFQLNEMKNQYYENEPSESENERKEMENQSFKNDDSDVSDGAMEFSDNNKSK